MGVGGSAGKSLLRTGHIQENNVVGRSRKRVRGEGRNRENRGMGDGRQPLPPPKPGTRVTLMPSPIFFVTQAQESQIPHPIPVWGWGEICARRCRRRYLPSQGPGGRRETGGSTEAGVWFPGAPQRGPSLLGRPFPPSGRREEVPRVSSTSRAGGRAALREVERE